MTTPPTFAAPPHHRLPRRRFGDLGRLLLGMTVLALGTLFLLDSAGVLDAGAVIDRWWPLVIVAAGLLTLAERPPSLYRGAVLAAAGGGLLLFTTDTVEQSAWSYVWPVAIVLAGLTILAHWSGRAIPMPTGADGDDVIRSTAVFSGSKVASASTAFRGAWLTAVFGGVTLDLRDAQLAEGGASVNATAALGGVEILVPRGWRVSVRSTPILGGVDDKTQHPAASDAPLLHVDAIAFLGGVDIKHEK